MNYYNTYHFPGYRTIYKLNNKKTQKHNSFFPYFIDDTNPNINLQFFYNTLYKNGNINQESLGSSYKYTIPKSIDDIQEPSHASISERQKRARLREHFNRDDTNNNSGKNDNIYNNKYFIFIIIIIILFIIMNNN
jgi:hypothetical protein